MDWNWVCWNIIDLQLKLASTFKFRNSWEKGGWYEKRKRKKDQKRKLRTLESQLPFTSIFVREYLTVDNYHLYSIPQDAEAQITWISKFANIKHDKTSFYIKKIQCTYTFEKPTIHSTIYVTYSLKLRIQYHYKESLHAAKVAEGHSHFIQGQCHFILIC